MFEKIFIEKEVLEHHRTKEILKNFSKVATYEIPHLKDVFEAVRKPYLHKRDSLQLFLAKKNGQLLKEAPLAYGTADEPHYYFFHSLNCIYECEYCFLQGYFHSPDIVFFVNIDEICQEMEKVLKKHEGVKQVWFHSGEFSDSLALSHIWNEWEEYWNFFSRYPKAKLEIRTKSGNIKSILNLTPLENVICSFSLSPEKSILNYDHKTANLRQRLAAMKKLVERGFKIAIHLDPIIYSSAYLEDYQKMWNEIFNFIQEKNIEYVSMGVVRFTQDVFQAFKQHYPESKILDYPMENSKEGKVRYKKEIRNGMLENIKKLSVQLGIQENKIYFCME